MQIKSLSLEELKKIKKQIEQEVIQLDSQQMAAKILINSVYGALGAQAFRYYDPRMAEAVTQTGQLTIRTAERTMNAFLNKMFKTADVDYVVAADTDSNYLILKDIFSLINAQHLDERKKTELLDKFCSDKLEPILIKTFNDLALQLNCSTNRISMKREGIASRSVWVAKKRYAQRVLNSEGVDYDPPKIKIMGIEAVRSSTPPACRSLIEDALEVMLYQDEKAVQSYVSSKQDWFKSLDINQIACPRTANNLDKYSDNTVIYTQRCPKHVRAALLYNHLIKKHNIEHLYESIGNGDKMKFVSLKMPNPIQENVIGFATFLPSEFGLHDYIDYDSQLEDNFIVPLQRILDSAGWNVTETNTLESFFA